ncbi:hypothetical protein D777_01607 [Marinobacter nitratireducens]|uniref:Uncharacterized protein n=1 Tax=Marinobacter nitratireducens TaxID=1137280 RepID=A0A072N2U0_9GAMM|nr:hypothetical protein D777_01607 [Marinobacter nitratireducens]
MGSGWEKLLSSQGTIKLYLNLLRVKSISKRILKADLFYRAMERKELLPI